MELRSIPKPSFHNIWIGGVKNLEDIKNTIGQLAYDSYGRTIGKIVGFDFDANDKAKSIKMISEKGEFLEFPIVQAILENNSVVCLPPREKEAREILKQLKTLNKRINALNQLYRSGEIREESYQSLKKNYESSFTKIKENREDVLERLEERKEDLNKQIHELQIIFASNKMQFLSGEISEKAFKSSEDIIRRHIDSATEEKTDIENISKYIASANESIFSSIPTAGEDTAETEDSKVTETDEETPEMEVVPREEFSESEAEDAPEIEEETPTAEEDTAETEDSKVTETDEETPKLEEYGEESKVEDSKDKIIVRIREDF